MNKTQEISDPGTPGLYITSLYKASMKPFEHPGKNIANFRGFNNFMASLFISENKTSNPNQEGFRENFQIRNFFDKPSWFFEDTFATSSVTDKNPLKSYS
jgi:hypothetical protein